MPHGKSAVWLENHPSGMFGFRLTILDFSCAVEVKIVDLMKTSPPEIELDSASGSVWIIAHYNGLIRFRLRLAFAWLCRDRLRVFLDKAPELLWVL